MYLNSLLFILYTVLFISGHIINYRKRSNLKQRVFMMSLFP